MAVDLEYFGVPPADYRELENRTVLTATAGQTTFSALYSPGYVDVYFNGASLDPRTEFTGTDGVNIVLTTPAALGDVVAIVSRGQVQLANVYTQAQVNALLVPYFGVATGTGDAQVVTTNPTFTSYVDGLQIKLRTVGANATATPTLVANGIAAKTIVNNFGDGALFTGDWGTNTEVLLRYNQSIDKLVLVEGAFTTNTPAQFDNSNQIVNSAFVKHAVGNFSNLKSVSAGYTILPSDAGAFLIVGSTGNIQWPLTLPAGAAITFMPGSGVVTVTLVPPAGGYFAYGGSQVTTIVLNGTDAVTIVSPGLAAIGPCVVSGGLASSSQFGTNIGYQKLPGGKIFQWGTSATTAGGGVTLTFPIAFPSTAYSFICSIATNAVINYSIGGAVQNTTTANVYASNAAGTGVAVSFQWFAVGV